MQRVLEETALVKEKKDSKVRNCIVMETLMTILIVWKQNCLSDNCMSSRKISQLGAVIADLPTHHRQFRLITPSEGCVDTLPTREWTCNMIANYPTFPEPKKVFSNLQLRLFTEEAPPQYSLQGSGWGRHSANKSLLNSACDASRSAISACCLCFIAGGTYREERGAMVKLYNELFCICMIFSVNWTFIFYLECEHCKRLQLHGYASLLIHLASEGNTNIVQRCLWIDDFTPGYRLLLLLGHTFD